MSTLAAERRTFYEELLRRRPQFVERWSHTVLAGGYGFRVEPGQAVRFVTVEGAQIVDVCVASSDDPTEHYASGTQVALEGLNITRLAPIWGTPPRSRPLATCLADTVRHRDNPAGTRDHGAHGAHCNPHHWVLYAGRHPATCYDNLRAGMAMVGLGQHAVHDNINLFENCALDPYSGNYFLQDSAADRGDYVELYAEIGLLVVISLCPYGSGGAMEEDWHETEIPIHPIRVEVLDTGAEPLPWPPAPQDSS